MDQFMKIEIFNKTYKLLRTPAQSKPEPTFVRWHLQTKTGMTKIYPKSYMMIGCIAIFVLEDVRRHVKSNTQDEAARLLLIEKNQSYNDGLKIGYRKGVSSVTNDRVTDSVMRCYLDFIVLNEARKTKKLQDEAFKLNEEKYLKMINDFS